MLLHVQLLREGGLTEKRELRRIADSLERAVQQQTQLIDQLRDGSQHPARELTLERRVHVDTLDEEGPKPERGAGWTLSFPLRSAADGASTDQTTPIPRRSLARPGKLEQYERLKDVRILCIDDDFITREAVWEVLELTGAQVALAASTPDGMMALDTFKPHVIVCDLAMPGQDGYTFMRKLRAYEAGRGAQIPVLAFTGLASLEDKRDALAAGFQMYLSKPIDIDRLRDAIAQLVGLIGRKDAPSPKT
jgi:CheY-like chemotaxis protein